MEPSKKMKKKEIWKKMKRKAMYPKMMRTASRPRKCMRVNSMCYEPPR